MSSGDRTILAKVAVGRVAVAGSLAVGALVAAAASAAADPAPAPPPAPELAVGGNGAEYLPGAPPPNAVPPSDILSGLAQNGTEAGPVGGLPSFPDMSGSTPNEYVLAQNPLPQAPGGAPGTPPNLNPLTNQYLLPQNSKPAAPGRGELYEIAPGEENMPIAPVDYIKRIWHGYQEGYWKGGFLGHTSMDQLGEPLPGTAPPPGTTLPVGLGQNLPDEAWAPPPPPALPPGAILPPTPEG